MAGTAVSERSVSRILSLSTLFFLRQCCHLLISGSYLADVFVRSTWVLLLCIAHQIACRIEQTMSSCLKTSVLVLTHGPVAPTYGSTAVAEAQALYYFVMCGPKWIVLCMGNAWILSLNILLGGWHFLCRMDYNLVMTTMLMFEVRLPNTLITPIRLWEAVYTRHGHITLISKYNRNTIASTVQYHTSHILRLHLQWRSHHPTWQFIDLAFIVLAAHRPMSTARKIEWP